jgi:hypothetical protein
VNKNEKKYLSLMVDNKIKNLKQLKKAIKNEYIHYGLNPVIEMENQEKDILNLKDLLNGNIYKERVSD